MEPGYIGNPLGPKELAAIIEVAVPFIIIVISKLERYIALLSLTIEYGSLIRYAGIIIIEKLYIGLTRMQTWTGNCCLGA